MEDPVASSITLFELNQLVRNAIQTSITSSYWIVAEISEINEHPSGHCYMELCQKDESSSILKAKARATIWNSIYRMLKPYFESTTGQLLARGMKILVRAQVSFNEVYGYSLNIIDIEPSFTVGEIELKRRKTIQQLTEDGVVEMNRELEFADVPKRVAIVSSVKAAGLQDFVNQLTNNPNGYVFSYKVFASVMQGDGAEASIIQSLNQINDEVANFDVVVIIRGGGAQSDLACFDSYELALNIAQFPLPIITGIGHDKDKSVADLVAKVSVKTPTAAAEFLIDVFTNAENQAIEIVSRLADYFDSLLKHEREVIDTFRIRVNTLAINAIHDQHLVIERVAKKIPIAVNRHIVQQNEKLFRNERKYLLSIQSLLSESKASLVQRINWLDTVTKATLLTNITKLEKAENLAKHLDPSSILKKGYSITYYNGKPLTDKNKVESGARIVTKLSNGELQSDVL